MENTVNKLNEYLKYLNVTGIRFKFSEVSRFNEVSRFDRIISIMLLRMQTHSWTCQEFTEYERFSDINKFFKSIAAIHNELKTRREIALEDISQRSNSIYVFAYHKINPAGIKFLKILSTCNSLEELELKLAIQGY
jgi:hypothetical protein